MPNNFDDGVYGSGQALGEAPTDHYQPYESDWDIASEIDEDEFLRQLEDDDEPQDKTKAATNQPSRNLAVQAHYEQRNASPDLIQRVFGVCELFELILLQLPACQVTTSCRLVQRYWSHIIDTSSVLRDHYSDPFVATLRWPPTASGNFFQYMPFQPVRRQYLGGIDFTELDWSRFKGNLRGSYLTLQSTYNKMNQSLPGIGTLESTTRGKLIRCRSCTHLHERFYTHKLHAAIQGFCSLSHWHLCFTGYGMHILMQLKVDREIHMQEMLAHFKSLLHPTQNYHTMPVAETLVKRFSVSIQGSLYGFSTTSMTNGTPSITLGTVLSLMVMLFIENCLNLVENWRLNVKIRRQDWKYFITHQPPAGMARHERKAEKARRKRLVIADKMMLNTWKELLRAWRELQSDTIPEVTSAQE